MVSLYLSDLFKQDNIDPKQVKLIRHVLKDGVIKETR
jgi:hypothetical protein